MSPAPDRPSRVAFIHGEIKSPPMSDAARAEVGALLRQIQNGERLGMPHSRPLPSIGPRCHELRVRDGHHNWRVIYRVDPGVILVVDVFAKKTRTTPRSIIDNCRERLSRHDNPPRE